MCITNQSADISDMINSYISGLTIKQESGYSEAVNEKQVYVLVSSNGKMYVGLTKFVDNRRFSVHKCSNRLGKNCTKSLELFENNAEVTYYPLLLLINHTKLECNIYEYVFIICFKHLFGELVVNKAMPKLHAVSHKDTDYNKLNYQCNNMVTCNLCNSTTKYQNLRYHERSKKHVNNLKLKQEGKINVTEVFTCHKPDNMFASSDFIESYSNIVKSLYESSKSSKTIVVIERNNNNEYDVSSKIKSVRPVGRPSSKTIINQLVDLTICE